MYGNVQIAASGARDALVVPDSAVIDTGKRQTVLVARGEGRFEPRDVKLGARAGGFVELQSGVKEGESVVTRANFLIDSESNLKAALGGMSASGNAAGVGHTAVGVLDEVDAKGTAMTITHDPVPSLKWPKMTMEFVPANEAIARTVKPGTAIRFEFVERKPGEWVVTKVEPAAGAVSRSPADKPAAHKH
jgi:Cu(I)/Ag(I) efflux system membrane fusion protein